MEEVAPEAEQVTMSVGQTLAAARTQQGKSIEDIAAKLRISERMLDALERDAYDELPAGPYAVGFARSYARALGLDSDAIAADVRAAHNPGSAPVYSTLEQYEPMDAARVPTRALAWTAAAVALLLVVGYVFWKSTQMNLDLPETAPARPATTAPTAAAPAGSATPAQPVPAVANDAPVRIAASSQVWFSLEDADGRSQFDLTLQGGEFYTLRPEQRGLLLRTGRPQSLRILLGDDRLPQLGPDDAIISGVRLDTASLAQRLRGAGVAPAATGVAPTTAATPATTR